MSKPSISPSLSNVTDELKPTTQTTYFKLFLLAALIGPFLLIALLALANAVLPPADAEAFKKPLLGVWAWITSASGAASLIGGLLRTYGKVSTQRELAIEQKKAGGVLG